MTLYINMFFSYNTERLAQTALGVYTSKRVATVCVLRKKQLTHSDNWPKRRKQNRDENVHSVIEEITM